MSRTLFLFTAIIATVGYSQETATKQAEPTQDWVDLFDGTSLDGWTQRGGKATYKIEDGMIVGSTVPNTPNSFLCTEKHYGNFEVQLEFHCDPELNSGIQIRSNSIADHKDGRVHGYQVEIDPADRAWSCGIYDEARRGWLNSLENNNAARYAFRQNDWNHYRIVCFGDTIRTWINGVPAANLTDDMTAEGFIGLQVHGVGGRQDWISVKWRNIRLRELTEMPADADHPNPLAKPEQPESESENEVVKLHDGFAFTEGASLGPDGRIYFTDIPNDRIHVYDPASGEMAQFREGTGNSNGLAWTACDAMIACENKGRKISRTDVDGTVTTIVDNFEGKKLNSPNDLTLDYIGGFYFTDPRYGNRDDMEMEVQGVYYVDRGRKITRVIDDLTQPNGIEMSLDGKTLYVSDLGANQMVAYDVAKPGQLSNKRVLADKGSDGMTIDSLGRLYITNGDSVYIFCGKDSIGPEGTLVRTIKFPENPTNLAFGGPDNKTLYVTAVTGFYSVQMDVAGGRAFANPKDGDWAEAKKN